MSTPTLAEWLEKAPDEFRQLLAELASTDSCMYRQWIAGRRGMSAEKAGMLENATRLIKDRHPDAPAPLLRGELCEACQNCEYFKSGRG